MDLSPGSRLGPYEIVSRLGAGGMGEVFRARDTRLERSVAIKVLPAEFARNAQFKLRFEREAKAISQLNHPNICTLYDVGDDYLVMELLEGESLADRLAKGPLPLADVLKYGAQIAEALDRAHRAGIVHRDLKPGNVMLTRSGAKLLDFGLAKSSAMQVDPHSATVQQEHVMPLTQEGTILGTFQYMAPEQLEAEESDARTDIFALGAVLYEMATGRRAFQGKTRTSLIAAIVGAQPQPVSTLMPLSPPALDHVIHKCLEKERDDRWQSAHDVAQELKWIATVPPEQKVQTARAARIAVAAAVLLALALAGVTALYLRTRNAPKPRTSFAVMAPKGWSLGRGHLLSPDGTMIVLYAYNDKNEGGLWLRHIDQIEPKRLTSDPDDYAIAFSPDSKWIAIFSKRQLKRMPVDGGTAEVISTHPKLVTGAAWGADGTFVYNAGWGEGIFAVRQDGAEPVPVTTLDAKRRESFHGWPQFLDDGKRFLYTVHTVSDQKNEIWAGSVDRKTKKLIVRADGLVGTALGRLYFTRDGAVYAQPFDEEKLELNGEPRRVAEKVGFLESEAHGGALVAKNGALAYVPQSNQERRIEVGWYDRGGRRAEKLFEDISTFGLTPSRDFRKLVGHKLEPAKGANDIYVIDLERGIRTKVTGGLSNHSSPVFSPAGDRVYFSSDGDGFFDIYAQAEDGATPAVPIWKGEGDKTIDGISPSGDTLAVELYTPRGQSDIWLVPADAPAKRRAFVATEASERNANFSPDGRWIAYASDRSGRDEVYLRPVSGGRSVQATTSGGSGFAWSADGTELYVRALDNSRVAIPLTFDGANVVPGKAVPLFPAPARDYYIIGASKEKGILMSTIPDPADYVSTIHYDSAPPLR
jgi:eukaryotic-like serine/threonine-protein kinase